MTKERALEIIENILCWGCDHDEEFKRCLVNAMDLTEEEIQELDLAEYGQDED